MKNLKPKQNGILIWALGILLLAAGGGWIFLHRASGPPVPEKKTIYTCPMHHQIREDHPGSCPICSMTLVPLEEERGTPTVKTVGLENEAGKAEEAVPGLIPVKLSPYKQQLIGVRLVEAKVEPLVRTILTVGRFAGGGGDFASLAGDFAAQNSLRSSGRYVVADVYALDLPFVKLGQKAFVTSLSGSGPRLEGRITYIFPYDGTQSLVTRVKINLPKSDIRDIFANVEIEAATGPKLAVPSGAVMDTGTRRYVFLQTDPGTFAPREITVGYEGDEGWEVLSGLKAGDQVVDGANFLVDADSQIKAAFAQEK